MDCGGCLGICPHEALDLDRGRITVLSTCTECDLCVRLCPVDALVSVHVGPAPTAGPVGSAGIHGG